jgi:hypothetical protein
MTPLEAGEYVLVNQALLVDEYEQDNPLAVAVIDAYSNWYDRPSNEQYRTELVRCVEAHKEGHNDATK